MARRLLEYVSKKSHLTKSSNLRAPKHCPAIGQGLYFENTNGIPNLEIRLPRLVGIKFQCCQTWNQPVPLGLVTTINPFGSECDECDMQVKIMAWNLCGQIPHSGHLSLYQQIRMLQLYKVRLVFQQCDQPFISFAARVK